MNSKTRTGVYVIVLLILVAADAGNAQQTADQQQQQSTRQAQAVSRPVFEKMQKSQDLLSKNDVDGALRILTSLVQSDKLSEYEKSNVLQYIGLAHHSVGDIESAIHAFDNVLSISSLEEQVRKNTLYILTQLNTAHEQYTKALQHLDHWFDLEPNPAPGPYILYAQILYQLDRHREVISPIEEALAVADARNLAIKEEWYTLLSFAYFQQENYSKIRDINKILLETWPRKRYWFYLANAYRELGDDDNWSAAYDAAYLQGMLETEAELVTLAQLYLQEHVPFKAAQLLETEMDAERVSPSVENYRLLSQAWTLAQENERSIEPLVNAARLAENGDLHIKLANVYLSLGRFEDCTNSVRTGFSKGDIKNPDYAQISLGMCLYNMHEYQSAIRAFREAAQSRRSERTANQWIRVVKNEIQRNEQISLAEALAEKRQDDLAIRRKARDRT